MGRPAATRISYTRATFRTPAHLADEAAGILVAGGALGCAVAGMTLPGARPEKHKDKFVSLEAYFTRISAAQLERLRLVMHDAGLLVDDARDGAVRRIVDPGWSTLWMKRFGPFRVGERFLIVPPWRRENQRGRTTIVIQPAQAFGTGHHPTTAGALRALETLMRTHRPARVLDAGTGSGVLAIAVALTRARERHTPDIIAVDIDPVALENALANARLNGVERAIRFSPVPLTSIRRRFDLITANILSHTLKELAPHLKRILAPGGRLVLGGFLADEADEVLSYYRQPLRCISRRTHRGWTTIVLARAPRS
jgi:ribosomal protein L11 methyltransferase